MTELLRAEPNDPAPLGAKAHSVRGFAGSLGFSSLGESLETLERACNDGSVSAPLLRAAYEAVAAARLTIVRRAAA